MRRSQADYAAPALAAAGRDALLRLRFARDGDATRLAGRAHSGPLVVQKPLYPEGMRVCHAIVVHPPGGVVGGDRLRIEAELGAGAAALLSTPGAGKWYKANGRPSQQQVRIAAGEGACLEWLPQETILFDAAEVRLDTEITLAAGAAYLGCEILCFGRTASGETFASGRVEQRTAIRRGGRLLWYEQGALGGGSAAMDSPFGLAGQTVCATLIAVGADAAGLAAAVRAGAGPECGVTHIKPLLAVRYLGASSEAARQAMMRAWQVLRPALAGREAAPLRIWNT